MTEAPRTRTFLIRTLLGVVVLLGLCATWSLASPLPSGPDEAAHLVKAGAVVEGILVGHPVAHHPATVTVTVPGVVASIGLPGRCDYLVARPAGCILHLIAGSQPVSHDTYVGRYPPLYYAAVALPLLVSGATWTLSASRVVGGLLVALCIGAAIGVAWTWARSRLVVLAVGAAVTPTVVYLGAVVNPSGLEIAAALLVWTCLGVLVVDRAEEPPGAVVVVAVVAGAALAATRPISTAILALIVVSVVMIRPTRARLLLRATRVKVGAVVGAAAAIASGVYVLAVKSYEIESFAGKHRLGLVDGAGVIAGGTLLEIRQAIDGFGAPNFYGPLLVDLIWVAVTVGLVAAALVSSARADRWRLAGMVAVLGFVVPFVITLSHVSADGSIWQGRYSLPLIVGFPILAALLVAERRHALAARLTGWGPWAAAALGCGQLIAFSWVLRRYTVGLVRTHGALPPGAFTRPRGYWAPAIPAPWLALAALVLTASWVSVIGVATWSSGDDAPATSEEITEAHVTVP